MKLFEHACLPARLTDQFSQKEVELMCALCKLNMLQHVTSGFPHCVLNTFVHFSQLYHYLSYVI